MTYTDAIVTTPDGRDLEVAAVGDPKGATIVFHHGTPGSAPLVKAFDATATERGYFIITMSRAGYGPSSRLEGRDAAHVVQDVQVALQHFGRVRYVSIGWSGGGPHALACAALDAKCDAVVSLAGVAPANVDFDWTEGMGPENITEFELARRGGPEYEEHLKFQSDMLASATADSVIELMSGLLPDADKEALADDEARTTLAAAFQHGCGTSHLGFLDDDQLFLRDWGFELSGIAVPTDVWFGGTDLMVPPTHGHFLVGAIAGATAFHYPQDGHVSIVTNHQGELFDRIDRHVGR